MRTLKRHQSTERETGPADWAALGGRIVRAAAIASAIHMAERARMMSQKALADPGAPGPVAPAENVTHAAGPRSGRREDGRRD